MPTVDAGGTELNYVRSGAGEPLLLIQGMSATHLAWGQPFLSLLEQSFECIAFDNRGMGLSGPAQMPFGIADLAADTAALLDALELERVHVLGISMGGTIAQELALAHPERIRTLSLGATWSHSPADGLMSREDLQMLSEAAASGEQERVFRTMWEINLSPGFRADDSRFAAFAEMAAALPAPQRVIVQQMQACIEHDTSDRLDRIELPTQVIHGTADRLIGVENGIELARLLGVSPRLLDDVGHLFWWEQPQYSAELVRGHALATA
ncbi:MAG TPA: alpha/beta hydrolase [Solirubrobacterales bacterium]|nr:alpha/beta hydrolase [Solirubrobacterales bacterium]